MNKTSMTWLAVGAVISPIVLSVGHVVVYAIGMVCIIAGVLFVLGKLAEQDEQEKSE